ncbi:hypothetical protein [Sphingobacterium faecale]|uniref:Outer membrane protein beta-barrel domain-containing protein n=1 Tax=Sphingobacterium faecale TaxID=2803775 RepID=A0ABS1R3Z4_9SPHI|nr:hypothetical protein [Sphingobacterium faecale]MBL1409422.1 hypothetical protein [Sphingobacterium faecale]
MTKYYILTVLSSIFIFSVSYAQDKKITISAHTNFSKQEAKNNSLSPINDIYRDFNLTPRISYKISKMWALGALYQYGVNKNTTSIIIPIVNANETTRVYVEQEQKSTTNTFGLFVQSYLYDNGKFAAFLEVDGLKGKTKTTFDIEEGIMPSPDIKYNSFSSGLHAGGRYTFFKGLGIEARLNQLVQYKKSKLADENVKDSYFRVLSDIWRDCSIGLAYQF